MRVLVMPRVGDRVMLFASRAGPRPLTTRTRRGELPADAARRALAERGLEARLADDVWLVEDGVAFAADLEGPPAVAYATYPDLPDAPAPLRQAIRAAVAGHPLVGLARTWLAAFNGRDLDGLLSLYAED